MDLISQPQKQAVQYQNYPTMTDLGQHFRALHFQSLAEENQELRRRVGKLTEIEGYVQLLVDKLQKAERREQMLSGENTLLRQQARELQIKFSQNESMHGDEMRYVFAQHDQLVEEKNRALALLKAQCEQINEEKNRTLSHLKAQYDQEQARAAHSDAELKNQRLTLQRAVQEYQLALSQLKAAKKELQSDLQLLYQSHQQERSKFTAEREIWGTEAAKMRAIIQEKNITVVELNKQADELSQALTMADVQLQKLSDYNKQLEITINSREKESTEIIGRLQQGTDVLRLQVERLGGENKALRAAKHAVEQELQQVKLIQAHLRSDNETYITDNQRLIFLLEEADKQNAFLREKQRQLQEYSSAENSQAKTENIRLREEIGVLQRNSNEREKLLGTRQLELKEVLNAKNTLQLQLGQSHSQFQIISEQLRAVQQSLIQQKQHATQLGIALKNAVEQGNKAKQAVASAEQVARKIQQEYSQLSAQHHALSRQLSNPRQMTKDYREQVDRMVKNFHDQRQEQAKRHWLQKEKLRQVYEYELKQKELEFARRTAELEEEILRGKRLEAMTVRATPAKAKV